MKHFANQTAERAREDIKEIKLQPTVVPLFIADSVLPGQVMKLTSVVLPLQLI